MPAPLISPFQLSILVAATSMLSFPASVNARVAVKLSVAASWLFLSANVPEPRLASCAARSVPLLISVPPLYVLDACSSTSVPPWVTSLPAPLTWPCQVVVVPGSMINVCAPESSVRPRLTTMVFLRARAPPLSCTELPAPPRLLAADTLRLPASTTTLPVWVLLPVNVRSPPPRLTMLPVPLSTPA
ncbi:Uncharacterised protein [Bordetella pertussis]|nr:Uncharacterised protein [Bordetella pertussis]